MSVSATDSGVETGPEESNDSMSIESHSSDHSSSNGLFDDMPQISREIHQQAEVQSNDELPSNADAPNHNKLAEFHDDKLQQKIDMDASETPNKLVLPGPGQSFNSEFKITWINSHFNQLQSQISIDITSPVHNYYDESYSSNSQVCLKNSSRLPGFRSICSPFSAWNSKASNPLKMQSLCKGSNSRWKYLNRYDPKFRSVMSDRKIMVAAKTNNVDRVRSLLVNGANPSAADDKKRTPLHLAACHGFAELVKVLLMYEANPNAKDIIGNTPLHLAALQGHLEIVTLLIKAGTDVKILDYLGRSPLQLAESRLKRLKSDKFSDSSRLKQEITLVVEMIQVCLQRSGQGAEVELLNMFTTRLNLRQTREEVNDDVQELLCNLNHLSLESNASSSSAIK